MKRVTTTTSAGSLGAPGGARPFSEAELAEVEAGHPAGLSTHEVVALFAARGERLSEATFRKYVQLGLLPRSVRVGRKGKHRGSQGLYPVAIVRQIDRVRGLLAQGYTIVDIQREFVGMRTEIDALSRQLAQVLATLAAAHGGGQAEGAVTDEVLGRALVDARQAGEALVEKLRAIEQRLAMRARMARAAV